VRATHLGSKTGWRCSARRAKEPRCGAGYWRFEDGEGCRSLDFPAIGASVQSKYGLKEAPSTVHLAQQSQHCDRVEVVGGFAIYEVQTGEAVAEELPLTFVANRGQKLPSVVYSTYIHFSTILSRLGFIFDPTPV